MPTTIYIVRHAQGFHNLSMANVQLPDPELTPLGKSQCADLNRRFPFHQKITHLVASPMRRTIYTALYTFEAEIDDGKRVVALPEVQEVSTLPCDIGSEPEVLVAEFPASRVDLGLVTPGWNDKNLDGPWAPVMETLDERARRARVWLRELGAEAAAKGGEAHIVVVTHGGFVHFLTQDWHGFNSDKGTGWENTEYRSYQFADPSGEDREARIAETQASWRRRRGSAIGLTETEQRELRAVVQGMLQEEFDKVEAAKHGNA